MRKLILLAAVLAAGCGGAQLRYTPAMPPFALVPARLAKVASVRFADESGGMQSMGTALMLKRHFYDSFEDAMRDSLAELKVTTAAAPGADVEIALTDARLERGQGFNADLTATVKYVLRVSRDGQSECVREGSGWAVLRESLVSSPDATAVQRALAKAADGLGPVLASSCLYSTAASTVAVAAVAPPAPLPRDPHLLVLAIGVEHYRDLPPARFAGADARAFAQAAESALGADPERVALAVGDDTTYASLRKYFEGWIPNRLGVGDTVLVYFAGRGATDGATAKAYLLPSDGDPAYLQQTAYPLARLYATLGRLPAQVFVVLDAGFSGTGIRSATPPGEHPFPVSASAGRAPNVVVLAAAAADQEAHVDEERAHGLFTEALLDALRDAPELRPAFDAAKPEVEKDARRALHADQTPQWSPQ